MSTDETVWKKRFAALAFVRVSGLLIFFLGIAIAFGDLVRPGGALTVGLLVALVGLVEAVLAPKLLRKAWDLQDQGRA